MFFRKKKASKDTVKQPDICDIHDINKADIGQGKNLKKKGNNEVLPPNATVIEPEKLAAIPHVAHQTKEENKERKELILGVSHRGKDHVKDGTPCQDCHAYQSLGDGWGIAIVSDGAGSALYAQRGSIAVCKIGLKLVEKLIQTYKEKDELPTEKEWDIEIRSVFEIIKDAFEKVAKGEEVDCKSFNATALVLSYSPHGMLVAHIGDGRMGYLDSSNTWHALITPHSGEEANQTIFVPSDWNKISNFKMSNVYVPETKVIKDVPKAFVLMSDGCENATWECSILNQSKEKYEDTNKPFDRFLNPMISLILEQETLDEKLNTFSNIIDAGNEVLEKENDDKTMIVGIFNI